MVSAIQGREELEFLDEVVPLRVSAEDAAAVNTHLKLPQSVIVNPDKKVGFPFYLTFC